MNAEQLERTKQARSVSGAMLKLVEAWREAWRPPENLDVDEWADRKRMMTRKSSSEPGKWRTERVPYIREILKCLSPSSNVQLVVFMKGSQVAGTECILCWTGHTIDANPWPMMIVQPTLELAKLFSRQRLDPMIRAAPSLSAKVRENARDSENTIFGKDFDGGYLRLAGANSAASLRQAPMCLLACDEIDEYPRDVENQGDPIALTRARQRRFPRRKTLLVSSPTVEGSSRIAEEFAKTDMAYYFVPCPDCKHMQRLVWANIKYERDDRDRPIPSTARYCCEKCGVLIAEHRKTWMFENGEWRSTHPELRGKVRGFHLSALYSPVGTFSWEECVEAWVDAQGNPELLKTFVNTILGETYKTTGDAPQWERLYNRREPYKKGVVPEGALVLVAGVDVQGGGEGNARIEYEVVGFGPRFESWSIDIGTIPGELSNTDVRAQVVRALERQFPMAAAPGRFMPVRLIAIDAAYDTAEVTKFVRTRSMQQWIAVHGKDTYPMPIGFPARHDMVDSGKVRRSGMRVYPVGTNLLKRQLYGWLKQEQPTDVAKIGWPDGWCHFPDQYPEEYFKQLCAESAQLKKNKRGYWGWEWVAHHRNEMLDCRVYARAAAALLQLDRYAPDDWKALADAIAGAEHDAPAAEPRAQDHDDLSDLKVWDDD